MAKTEPVTFRVDTTIRKKAGDRAGTIGVTLAEYVRNLLLEDLNDERELVRLRMKIVSLEEVISDLREDISLSVRAIMVLAGGLTAEEVDTWISKNLKSF